MKIEIKDVTKSFGGLKALNKLSLSITKGTIFGLLGVNGAGKSTLLSILNGLSKIDSGSVEVFGMDMTKDRKKVKKISSIVPQNLAFYEQLTVKENLDFFADIQNATKEDYDRAIEINTLSEILDQEASTLSGGQKRRLNIAIGILNAPEIIYFDEPTVGIDPKSRNEILDSIKSYKAMGITVIYTSHYMNEIERICDEVAIISKGQLVKQDTLENLLNSDSSDKILIDVIYEDSLDFEGLNVVADSVIETTKTSLTTVLDMLDKRGIAIKEIRYGVNSLESHFLDLTGDANV